MQHAGSGQNIFLYSSKLPANEFIAVDDDVSLIDFVQNDPSKKIWHCSNVKNSDLLAHIVITAYNETTKNHLSARLAWLEFIQKSKSLPSSTRDKQKVQFLGLVSLYLNNTGSKVCAFHLHSFVLYRSLQKNVATRVDLMLTQEELIQSSVQERLLQILQIIQNDEKKSTALCIAPDYFEMSHDLILAYKYLGVTQIKDPKSPKQVVLTRKSLLRMTVFTNRSLWTCYGHYLSIPYKSEGFESAQRFMCRMFSDLLLRPIQFDACFAKRFPQKLLQYTIEKAAKTVPMASSTMEWCYATVMALVKGVTRL